MNTHTITPPKVIAHRFGYAPEGEDHPRTALIETLQSEAHSVELDVRCLEDGTFVAHYSETVKDLYGKHHHLTDLTYKKFAWLYQHRNHQAPTTAEESLARIAESGKEVFLDLKTLPDVAAETKLLDMVRETFENASRVSLTSRHPETLKHLHKARDVREQPVNVVFPTGTKPHEDASFLNQTLHRVGGHFPRLDYARSGADSIASWHVYARRTVRRYCHSNNIPLHVYTVDDPLDLTYWMRPGRCHAVITNDPETALSAGRLYMTTEPLIKGS